MSSDEDVVEERIYNVPLRRASITPIKNRVPRAIRMLKAFVMKNMKTDDVKISSDVNEKLWSQGIEGFPRKIRIRAVKDSENIVTISLVKGE